MLRQASLVFTLFLSSMLYAVTPKDTFVLAWDNVVRSYDPRYSVDADSQYLENLVHCSLIDFDKEGNLLPSLATSWKWLNPKTLEMSLKPAKFSNGKDVTALDVKKTFEFFLNPNIKIPSPRSGAFQNIEAIEAKGSTLIFHLKKSDAAFISNLVVGILPTDLVNDSPISEAQHIVGCGPFQITSASITGVQLIRNPHYSLSSAPKIAKIDIKIVKDETTRFAKLLGGEVDLIQNGISLEKLENFNTRYPKLELHHSSSLKTAYLGFNTQDKILKDLRVRQAISQAIDKKSMIKFILKDLAKSAKTILPPGHAFINSTLSEVEYNVAKSKKILDDAGYKPGSDGVRLTLSYKSTTHPTRLAVAHAIAGDLKKIGIKLNIEMLEWGRFKDDVDKGRVQMWGLTWIGFKDPDIYRYAFASESFPPNGANRGRFSNPELDKLLEEGQKEVDTKKRTAIYQKVQSLVADQLPYVFLFHEDNFVVTSRSVKAFEVYADGRFSSLKNAYKD